MERSSSVAVATSYPLSRLLEGRVHKHWATVALFGAVIAGAMVRLPFIGDQSLWYDEVFTKNIVSQPNLTRVFEGIKATELTPPLFYVLTWLAVKAIGSNSDVAIRIVSLVAGVLTIPIVVLALRRFVGRGPAIAAAWMTALSPLMIHYSLDARAYPLFVLLCLLSLWSMGRVLDSTSHRRFAVWILIGLLCLYTNYFSVFALIAEGVLLLWYTRKSRTLIMRLCIWGMTLIALALPLALLLLHQNDGRGPFVRNRSLRCRIHDFVIHYPLGGGFGHYAALLQEVALLLASFGFVLGLGTVLYQWRTNTELPSRSPGSFFSRSLSAPTVPPDARLLIVFCALTLGVSFLLSALNIDHHFYFRYLLFVWPCMAGIAALGLLRFKALPFLAYLGVFVFFLGAILLDWRVKRADWRTAAADVVSLAHDAPIVVHGRSQGFIARNYLNRDYPTGAVTSNRVWVMLEPTPISGKVRSALRHPPKGFTLSRSVRTAHGFHLLEYKAVRPLPLDLDDWKGRRGGTHNVYLLVEAPVSNPPRILFPK